MKKRYSNVDHNVGFTIWTLTLLIPMKIFALFWMSVMAGRDLADTVLIKGETMHVLGQKGLLARYDPLEDDKNAIDKMFRHPENLWTTVYLAVHSIVYSTRRIAPKDIPRRYTDLLKPQWKDKIGVSTTKLHRHLRAHGSLWQREGKRVPESKQL